jgi:hypothetical protein
MSTQGLFNLVRVSANHLLRHLLRTVDPRLTTVAFEGLDGTTSELVGRLFHASASDLTDVTRTRLGLPGSMGGLGITPYEIAAQPAYLGCLFRIGPSKSQR